MNERDTTARIKSLERQAIAQWFLIALLTIGLFAVAGVRFAHGQEIAWKAVETPAQAVAFALADASQQPYPAALRYVWVPPWGNANWVRAVCFAVNLAASKPSTIQYPGYALGADRGTLLRWDLRKLSFDENTTKGEQDRLNDLAKFTIEWDRLALQDPYIGVADYKTNVVRVAPHADHGNGAKLQQLTHSAGPVYRADWLITKMLTTTEGGRYYEFRGIERKPKKGTAQQAFFESLGTDEATVQKLSGDVRSGLFSSRVTGKPRRVDIFRSVGGRQGSGLVAITHDVADGDIKAGQHPIRNLIAFEDKAREVIAELPNGLHVFALFNNQGALQDVVPPDVAKDHTIPAPNTGQLIAALGCISCHGPDHGLQTVTNDVRKLLSGSVDVFDDFLGAKKGLTQEGVVARLAGLYAGDFDKVIRRGRDDYSDAVFKASLGQSVPEASATIVSIHRRYRYDQVTPEIACLEMGWKLEPKQDAIAAVRALLPPLPRSADGLSREDPIIAALKMGISISRADWESVYRDAAWRAQVSQGKK